MSMEYVMQEMPDMKGAGKKKVFPKVRHVSCIPHDTVVSLLMDVSTLSRSAIESVMSEFPGVLNMYLQNNHSVKIDGFGTFSVILGQLDAEDGKKRKVVNANRQGVYVKAIHFQPDAKWLRALRMTTDLQRVGDVVQLPEVTTTAEERLQVLLGYLEKEPFVSVRVYAGLTGLSHTRANQELNAFCADPASGIRSQGVKSHKVYVKAAMEGE